MFVTSLIVVASFVLAPLSGVQLDKARLTEPGDLQPALGVNIYQDTLSVYSYQPASVMGEYQPTLRVGALQGTVDPQAQWQLDE